MKSLPKPQLSARHFGARRVFAYTDSALFDASGVRIAFTSREGGVSEGNFASLNLGRNTNDAKANVLANTKILQEAFGICGMPLVVPSQVHGTNFVNVKSANKQHVSQVATVAHEGADAVVVSCLGAATYLCFADCVPVILVSPTGTFAVCHAGWRGVVAGIVPKVLKHMLSLDAASSTSACAKEFAAEYNAYIGPHIRECCFEVGESTKKQFEETCLGACTVNNNYVSMSKALVNQLTALGVSSSRICDVSICTKCNSNKFFSYRASNGVCGRHAAIAFRR